MKKKFQILLIIVLFCSVAVAAQEFYLNSSKIDKQARKLVRKDKVPGLAISIIKSDSLIFSKGYGYANLKNSIKVNPKTTLFRIGSISKSLSAYGLARAVEQKLIKLDTSAYIYLPQFPIKEFDFTIRDLGGHIAGIRGYKDNEFKNSQNLTIIQGLDFFKNDSLLFEPKTNFTYTSYGWNLISLAIQNASGVPFENYMQKNVFDVLGLNNTIPDKNEDVINKASFYNRNELKRGFFEVDSVSNFYKLAGGGYLSTSEDIAIFGKALLKFENVDKVLLTEFITSQKLKNKKKTFYGIGFQTSFDHQNRPYYGHFGSSLGGFGLFYVYPQESTVIVILINCSDPKQKKRFNKVIDAVFVH